MAMMVGLWQKILITIQFNLCPLLGISTKFTWRAATMQKSCAFLKESWSYACVKVAL